MSEQEWWMGDGGRIVPPKPPKGMRWVEHPFNKRKFVLDAELPQTPAERIAGWKHWETAVGVTGMVISPLLWLAGAIAVFAVLGAVGFILGN